MISYFNILSNSSQLRKITFLSLPNTSIILHGYQLLFMKNYLTPNIYPINTFLAIHCFLCVHVFNEAWLLFLLRCICRPVPENPSILSSKTLIFFSLRNKEPGTSWQCLTYYQGVRPFSVMCCSHLRVFTFDPCTVIWQAQDCRYSFMQHSYQGRGTAERLFHFCY